MVCSKYMNELKAALRLGISADLISITHLPASYNALASTLLGFGGESVSIAIALYSAKISLSLPSSSIITMFLLE